MEWCIDANVAVKTAVREILWGEAKSLVLMLWALDPPDCPFISLTLKSVAGCEESIYWPNND